jgi:hypothetical protein
MRNPDPPKTPPPNFVPDKDKAIALGFTKTPGVNVVLSSTVMPCQFKFTYMWMKNKTAFWTKPDKLTNTLVGCWVWSGSKWNYRDIALKDIDTFICEYF